ncbi:MAG TPA: XrtA/PEP-CTERM system TPR-repeat protein PrsT [Sulfuriferula sp.]|nr:XrtA/PEP-CTERM system TPR-repeat protein PrsT [Sulfuriferula sp.]
MLLKPIQSALILALLATSTLQGCDHNANLTEQQLIQRAKDFEDKGDLKAGVIELKSALQKNPNSPQARLLLGQIYLKDGMGAEAESELQKAQKLGVSQETIKPLLGEALLLMGKYDRVLAEIQPDDTTSKPNLARIYQMRGEALLKTGKLQEACNLFQQSLDTDTNNPPTYWGLAQCAVAGKDMSKAKALLDTALKINDKRAKSWVYMGDLEQQNNNPQAALAAYTNAVKADPNSLEALSKHATLNIALGQLEPAKTDIKKISSLAPHSLLANYSHALLSFKQGDFSAARDSLQEALQIAPDYLPSLLLSGAVNYSMGSYEQAASQLNKVLEKVPGNPYARKLLAATQVKLGLDQRALATLQPLMPEQSNDTELLTLAANIYFHAKEYTKANQMLERAAAIDPKNAAIRTGLGVSLLASGETERALADLQSASALNVGSDAYKANTLLVMTLLRDKQFDRALQAIDDLDKKQPNNPITYNFRGGAYLGKNDLANARKSFEQALAIKPDFFPAAANLAQLDLQAKNPAAARKRFESILNADKNNLQAMMALAELASISKQEKDYVGWLEKAVKSHPEAIPPRTALTRYYLTKNEPQKALALANDAVNANPDNPDALNLLGATQMATNDKAGAIITYTKLAGKGKPSAAAYWHLALAQLANKNPNEARTALQTGLQLDSGNMQILDTLLGLNLAEKKLEPALQIARQIEAKHPEMPLGYEREADILVAQKQLPQAIKVYTQALEKGAGSTVFIKLLNAQFDSGAIKVAEQGLRDWLKQHPGDNAVRAYAAEYYISAGRNKDAITEYLEIQKQAPDNASILNNLASLFLLEKDTRALPTAEHAFKLSPDSPAIQDTLGWILVTQGQTARGLDLLRKAVAKMPDEPNVRYHYATALANSGDKAQARQELSKLLADHPKFQEAAAARKLLNTL